MRIGISISSTHQANGPQLMIERARAAYSSGLASMTIGDRHSRDVPYAQNTPMLGRLLAEWPNRAAGCLFLVPLWNPLLMAEQIGTLAAMHKGPFIAQAAIGWGADQFAAFGKSERDRGRTIDEAVPMVKQLLAGQEVDSPLFNMVGGRVGLLPDHPVEWWVGAGADAGLERTARWGDVWYGAPTLSVDDAKTRLAHYRDHGGKRAVIRKDALVLSDGDRARSMADEIIAAGYRGMGREQLVVGHPDDAAEQLNAYFELGFEELVVRCMSVPQDLAIETIELLGGLSA